MCLGLMMGRILVWGVHTLYPPPTETTLRLCMRDSKVMIMGNDRHGTSGMLRQRWLVVKTY